VLQRKREDDVELYPPCHEFAGRILSALKHVTVITSTGLGKTVDMDLGHNIMKTAVNYRCRDAARSGLALSPVGASALGLASPGGRTYYSSWGSTTVCALV
jgi:hypothetical protein